MLYFQLRRPLSALVALLVALLLLPAQPAVAQPPASFVTNQDATLVIGQTDFTGNAQLTTADGLKEPIDVLYHSASGKLFVVDTGNHRILRYSGVHAMTRGLAAEAVFGQSNFTSRSTGAGASELNIPLRIALDAAGNLWVADSGNSRVVRYADALTSAGSPAAVQVLGQSDFGLGGLPTVPEISASRFDGAISLAVTGTTLYVGNFDRVLRFDNATTVGNGAAATQVFGRSVFTGTAGYIDPPTASSMHKPEGMTFDSAGRLYVADCGSNTNRVTRFNTPLTAANGAAASAVLPWNSFTYDWNNNYPGVNASSLQCPLSVAVDEDDNLYVSDSWHNRIVRFPNASTITTGATADLVIGRTDLNSASYDTTRSLIQNPGGISLDADGNLWVSDISSNRVVMFAKRTTNNDIVALDAPSATSPAAYDPLVDTYTYTFTSSADITFSLTLSNPFALISMDGNDYGSTQEIGPLTVSPGSSVTYPLTVTATDGSSTRTITLTFVREPGPPPPPPTPEPTPEPTPDTAVTECDQTPDLALSPAEIDLPPGGRAEVQVAMRNLCADAPYSGADLLYSLSDGLSVAGLPPEWVNLGQRAAWQNLSLAPGETRSFTLQVEAAPALPTAPLQIVELYRAGSVQSRIDGVFVVTAPAPAAAEAPAPSAPLEPPTASPPAPLPVGLPNTAGAAPVLWLLLSGAALITAGLAARRR